MTHTQPAPSIHLHPLFLVLRVGCPVVCGGCHALQNPEVAKVYQLVHVGCWGIKTWSLL